MNNKVIGFKDINIIDVLDIKCSKELRKFYDKWNVTMDYDTWLELNNEEK